jgi:hypothetical protein
MYKTRFDRIMTALSRGKDIEDLLTTLFIFRYLERIGDALLNMGEALLFAIKGEKLKIEQYETLQETLSNSQLKATLPEVEVSAILGSRSGCRISRIQPKHGDRMQGIFKEGNKKKIRCEHENMRQWEAVRPGLVPRVFGYHENNGSAALIVEHLSGFTLEETLLNSDEAVLDACLASLMKTMGEIWRRTLRPGPFSTDYMAQLEKAADQRKAGSSPIRKGGKVAGESGYPFFTPAHCGLFPNRRESFRPLSRLHPRDFNVNNVFYDAPTRAIRYIDLYRSKFADYVQDASVFLVSNYRLPFFDHRVRKRLNGIIVRFMAFFKAFSLEISDPFFEARMALALVRSLYTSTRFELNPDFSRSMFLSAHFLMESLVSCHTPLEEYTMPRNVLFY